MLNGKGVHPAFSANRDPTVRWATEVYRSVLEQAPVPVVKTACFADELLLPDNLLLVNLCCSNLLCAVLTKSISVVHIGYAVAAAVTESHIAFCLIYTFRYQIK